ncbi:MAG: hypothetical protein PHG15_00865 [Acinetobacter sp.]|uniref:hypothetical protein n=1 Tax=Acinetobacter sp. TaxID=472 RepID=UPI002615E77C|nr:hypothetical protein [Acinetobacter sp.]MDD2944369.1 hypothetical protein [Acinetobacter sp.]
MLTQYQDYKNLLKDSKIDIDDSDEDLSNSIFVGCTLGLFDGADLICTFPYFPQNVSDTSEYRTTVNRMYFMHGVIKRVALYFLKNKNQYFAVVKNKRAQINLEIRDAKRDNIEKKKDTKLHPTTIKIHFEDKEFRDAFGVLKTFGRRFSFLPILVFNADKCTAEIKQAFIPIAAYLGDGDLLTGMWYISKYRHLRMFKIEYFPEHLKYGRTINDIMCFYDLMISEILTKRSRKSLESVFVNNRFVKKSIFMGDPINYDWFGREFGFWIRSDDGRVLRLYSESYTDKGITTNLEELGE